MGVGFAGVVGGSPEGSLLHHAAWAGSSELVRRLLDRGADPSGVLDRAAHGSRHHDQRGSDHVAIAELLVTAGEEPTPEQAEEADGPLHDWLADRV